MRSMVEGAAAAPIHVGVACPETDLGWIAASAAPSTALCAVPLARFAEEDTRGEILPYTAFVTCPSAATCQGWMPLKWYCDAVPRAATSAARVGCV